MPFSGIILSIQYKELEPTKIDELPKYYSRLEIESFTDCNGEDMDKSAYLAEMKVQEIKSGRKPRKHKFNITLYIDEDTFLTEDLHEGDIIQFDKVKMNTDNFRIKVYDAEKLKDYPKAKLHKDEGGRTYANIQVMNAKLSCPLGEWKRKFRFDELYYFGINRVKFWQTCEQDFQQDLWEMYLDKSEYNKLKDLNEQAVEVKCYAKKIKKTSFMANLTVSEEKEINKYYCKIERIK